WTRDTVSPSTVRTLSGLSTSARQDLIPGAASSSGRMVETHPPHRRLVLNLRFMVDPFRSIVPEGPTVRRARGTGFATRSLLRGGAEVLDHFAAHLGALAALLGALLQPWVGLMLVALGGALVTALRTAVTRLDRQRAHPGRERRGQLAALGAIS